MGSFLRFHALFVPIPFTPAYEYIATIPIGELEAL